MVAWVGLGSGGAKKSDQSRMYFGEFVGPTDEVDIRSGGKKRNQE